MNRRTFLGASAVVAAGCGTGPDRPTPGTTPFSNDRLASDLVEREQHLERLANFRVPADAVRTTQPPPIAAVDEFPELKPLMKVAARLHPRYGAEPGVTATKVGGTLAGPPPPSDDGPVVPVLQLRIEDAPPLVRFAPHTDLLQLYWLAGTDANQPPTPILVFTDRASPTGPPAEPPSLGTVPAGLVPIPCRTFPERVTEYPPPIVMPRRMRERIEQWSPPQPGGKGSPYFADWLAAAPGVKVGGWPPLTVEPVTPTCRDCRRLMDYLLTVAPAEWDESSGPRWLPVEERGVANSEGYRTAVGLTCPPVHVFVCGRCDTFPAAAVFG